MNKTNTFHTIGAMLAIVASVFLASCQSSTDPNGNPGGGLGGAASSGVVSGKVVSTGNFGVAGVEVRIGTSVAYTNSKGEFYMAQAPAGKRVLVTFRSSSHAMTQKIVAVGSGRATYVEASMLPYGTQQNLNASAGGTVSVAGATVVFPANALVDSKGNAFAGTALVKATYFDPTGAQFYGCFPGEFAGVRTDASETGIESFGFINVEISANAQKLQLASGKQSQITMPIPAALRAKAPQTIPLWYYDETQGKWIEEGSATKVGNNYVGSVGHFSNWNCDMPNQTSFLEGKVVDVNGVPLSFANVQTTGVDYTGSSRTQTDDLGHFKIAVKSSATAKVWASFYIVSSTPQNISTPATGLVQDIGTIVVPVDTAQFCSIIGRVIDNGNLPVSYMSVVLKDGTGKQIDYLSTNKDGKFRFFGEAGTNYTLEVSWYGDSVKNSKTVSVTTPVNPGTVDVGDIKVDLGGSLVIGRAVDSTGTPLANVMVYAYGSSGSGGQNREAPTDATGRFTISVKPNITFQLSLYYLQKQKVLTVTSPNLGETKDLGDITMP